MKGKTKQADLDSPAAKFVANILREAVARRASRIVFERSTGFEQVLIDPNGPVTPENIEMRRRPRGSKDRFTIYFEIEGETSEVAMPPVVLWEKVISRLKVLARMIDYGPRKSTNGTFDMTMPDNSNATFLLTTNPNPFEDNEVDIEVVQRQ